MAFGEHPMGDPMMDPEAALRNLPKPRRKIWRQEVWVDDIFLMYKDQSEDLPDPELVQRIFLLARRGDRHLVVRHGGRGQPWELPILEFEIEPQHEPDDAETDQQARRAELTQTIRSVVLDTWQVPITDWSQHTLIQMTARNNQDAYEPGVRRYEMVVVAQCGEPEDLNPDNEWSRRFFRPREMNQVLRERYMDREEIGLAHEQQVIEAAKSV